MQDKTINGFELKRLLGTGGMAEVWYAESNIGMKAAVKIMSEKLSHDEQMQERFLNEAKVMVELDHPNIRKVHGYGSIDNRPAIIMEYLDGSDLKKRMKNGWHFTDEELKRWWNQMVDALNYTHAQGIVHRDIKPSNIFIDQKGNAKLLDFGIAKVADTTTGTLTGSTLGTRIYMSPEQVKDPKRVGTASDVYSLAVSFVHLLTGKAPYDSTTDSDYDIQESIVRKPVDLGNVPEAWRGFLAPYLEKKSEDRPALRPFEMMPPSVMTQPVEPDDEGTIVNNTPKKHEPKKTEPQNPEPKKEEPKAVVKSELKDGNKPKSKSPFWIAFGVITAALVVLVAVVLLVLRVIEKSKITEADNMAYQSCATANDYRAYIRDYGNEGLCFNEAKAEVEKLVADSTAMASQAIAEEQARLQAEAEARAKAEAEQKEDVIYENCITIAGCDIYLEAYPEGRYVKKVEAKKAELKKAAEQTAAKKEAQKAEEKKKEAEKSARTGEKKKLKSRDQYERLLNVDLSVRYLNKSDLSGLSARELTYLRNSIYAKHGYVFKSDELDQYFSQFSWYYRNYSVTDAILNSTERANTIMIKEYQKEYGKDYMPN